MSLQPSFSVQLGHKVVPKTVCVGAFDGINLALAAATVAGKIFLHTPNGVSGDNIGRLMTSDVSDISLLSINQSVKCLAAGRLALPAAKPDPDKIPHDILVIGTPTNVLAYDVFNNSDLFFKEVADGANCIAVGLLGGYDVPLAICGGNCAIQGFDIHGNDLFWTVTGDNVCSLCLCDFDNDGKNELVVGSEDFDIRVFKMDEIIAEMTETEAVTTLCAISGCRFAYALANGTLGVYEGKNRIWRIKSKNHVMCIRMFDIDGDGSDELVTGWSNGKVDFRLVASGEVVLKEQLPACIAGVVSADYRKEGVPELICCSTEGEMRGYLPLNKGGVVVQMSDPLQDLLRDLAVRKQNLLLELHNYEENRRVAEEVNQGGAIPNFDRESLGIIPANTQLQTTLCVNPGSEKELPCVELYVTTSNTTLVKSVIVFAEGVFNGESHVVHPNLSIVSNSCTVQLRPEKDIAVDLHVKALVGFKSSVQYHVFELTRTLPKFSMFALCNDTAPSPQGYINFTINERVQRVALWVNENFLLQEEIPLKEGKLDARFFSLRGSGMLFIQMNPDGQVFIRCDDMELTGDVVQTLADYLGLEDLNTTAEYAAEVSKLVELMEKVNDIYSARDRLSADIADRSGLIKGLLVRAEDARNMGDMPNMKTYYTELYNVNQELITQYKVRSNNNDDLLSSLKMVNQIIQRAGKLRVGKSKSEVINACRSAIKSGNVSVLSKIIRAGTS